MTVEDLLPRRAHRLRVALTAAALTGAMLASACTTAGPRVNFTPTTRPSQSASPAPSPSPAGPVVYDSGPVVAPAQGALLGAWVRPTASQTQADRIAAVRGLQKEIGRQLDIVNTYRRFDDPFPTDSDRAFLKAGSTLMVSWALPASREVDAGKDDKAIAAWARRFAAVDAPMLLRMRWEMDRKNIASDVGTPAEFVTAWKRVRGIFAAQHVTNVSFVFCPTAAGFEDGTAQQFYPGDGEVDWICADVYATNHLDPIDELMGPFLKWSATHPKPIIIGEFGVSESWGGVSRASWLNAAAQTFQENPQIKAISYFDSNPDGNVKSQSYRLPTGSHELAAFAAIARMPYFNPNNRTVKSP